MNCTSWFRQIGLRVLACCLCALSLSSLHAQESELEKNNSHRDLASKKYLLLPLGWYSPSTSLGLGAVAVRNLQLKGSRHSNLQFIAAYTFRNQVLVYAPFEIFAKENQFLFKGELGYYDYIYDFFGVGNQSRKDDKETYDLRYFRLRFDPDVRVYGNIYVGLKVLWDENDFRRFDEEGTLINGILTGTNDSRMTGLGFNVVYDSRDDVFFPSKGYRLNWGTYWSGKGIGSDHTFNRSEMNLAKYVPLQKESVLALQLYFASVQGDAPFNYLAELGGTKLGRGYRSGRFRDSFVGLMQAEYRFPVKGPFWGTTFASLGRVADEASNIFQNQLQPAGGFGIRYRLDKNKKLNVRADFGFGRDSFGFYFTVGEAF